MSGKRQKQKRKREGVAKIVKWDHEALKARCEDVEPGEVKALLRLMVRALKRSATGVGLAAPQIGVIKRMALIWPTRRGEPLVLINPEIIARSEDVEVDREGCLSYPGVFVDVTRSKRVTVKYREPGDWRMVAKVRSFAGFEARIVQHELDHLDGVCLVGDAWRARK